MAVVKKLFEAGTNNYEEQPFYSLECVSKLRKNKFGMCYLVKLAVVGGSVYFSAILFFIFRILVVSCSFSYFLFLKFRNSDVSFRNSETNSLEIESRSKTKMFITAFVF